MEQMTHVGARAGHELADLLTQDYTDSSKGGIR
jgi:hypothetical protein